MPDPVTAWAPSPDPATRRIDVPGLAVRQILGLSQTLVSGDLAAAAVRAGVSAEGVGALGLAEGDDIHWPNPNGGTLHLVVQEVEDQPERAGHYDL